MSPADSVLTVFPIEVLQHIAVELDRPDLARLLRINSFFHQAFVTSLYTRVPSVVIQNLDPGSAHRRPPLRLPAYARHARCLSVPVWPASCCRLPSKLPHLPSLGVIILEAALPHGHGIVRLPTEEETLCPLPPTLKPKTVVMRYPFIYDGGAQFPAGLLTESTELVAFLNLSGGIDDQPGALSFGTLLDIVDFEIPESVYNMTIVLDPSTRSDWKFFNVATLIRLCDHYTEGSIFPFENLLSLTFVLGDGSFASSSRDAILENVRSELRENVHKAAADPDFEPRARPFEINIMLLHEFLASKKYSHVLSKEETAQYLLAPSSLKHVDTGGDVQDVIGRAREASAEHILQMHGQMEGDESGSEGDDDYEGYNDEDPEFLEEEDLWLAAAHDDALWTSDDYDSDDNLAWY
ncbi:hypothetical protein A1Q1_03919 [Trichosporon asahii var. asahii CBS 2479]|uniref:F-box domain-containing protein n=1 Tax=Trichosporon asahii var. asahii (strain ATCC 90039 / CBS 2479 / JCM 2466 / KCTC 7840 / NBRC 103889/ NCYC 2677 / UAMH 7654) TaxID=1186058 RepID=J4U9H8_TRIAS|nr:hypothetical protein A1Q1_03919 [Trichosporon asahii var. asahii CBS 2479]EJT47290.1 hypothetical protein A1Q1_03919 [Trichosporon asahii var. asahii CBS 2479]